MIELAAVRDADPEPNVALCERDCCNSRGKLPEGKTSSAEEDAFLGTGLAAMAAE